MFHSFSFFSIDSRDPPFFIYSSNNRIHSVPIDFILEFPQQSILRVLVDLGLVLDALGTVSIPEENMQVYEQRSFRPSFLHALLSAGVFIFCGTVSELYSL